MIEVSGGLALSQTEIIIHTVNIFQKNGKNSYSLAAKYFITKRLLNRELLI